MAKNRYLRNKDLISQRRLTSVSIIGAGGVGSALVIGAAMMGFKRIHIWDFDTLEDHNLSTTMYPETCLGLSKVDAAQEMGLLFNKEVKVIPHNIAWDESCELKDVVFMAPDNMEIRFRVHNIWKKKATRKALIDMRMGALTSEVITVDKDNDCFISTWKPSDQIEDEPCTAKHTIFTAMNVSSVGLAQAFNLLHGMPYFQYIWTSLAPVSFRKERLILNQNKEQNDKEREAKSHLYESGVPSNLRTTQGR